MENAPSTSGAPPKGLTADVKSAWPRSAQLVMAFLLGLATALLVIHSYGYLRLGSRPTDLERGPGLSYRIDLNRADRAELLQLPGIGENLADRIEEYRRDHGAFHSVNDLTAVRGIGPVTLERLRSWIQVSAEVDRQPNDALPAKPSGTRAEAGKPAGKKESGLASPIDVNRASATELQRLPGIGPKMAQRIVEERQKAPFKTVEDLRRVKGIGPKILERLRPHIRIESDPERVAVTDRA